MASQPFLTNLGDIETSKNLSFFKNICWCQPRQDKGISAKNQWYWNAVERPPTEEIIEIDIYSRKTKWESTNDIFV